MTYFDIGFFVVLVFSLLVGFIRGFITEMVSLFKYIVAFIAAKLLTPVILVNFPNLNEKLGAFTHWIVFAALFIIITLLITILYSWLQTIVKGLHLKGIDSILGVIYGFLRAVVFGVVAIVISIYTGFVHSDGFKNSMSTPYLYAVSLYMMPNLPKNGYSTNVIDSSSFKMLELPDFVLKQIDILNKNHQAENEILNPHRDAMSLQKADKNAQNQNGSQNNQAVGTYGSYGMKGTNGTNGANGTNGPNGANGANSQPQSFKETVKGQIAKKVVDEFDSQMEKKFDAYFNPNERQNYRNEQNQNSNSPSNLEGHSRRR